MIQSASKRGRPTAVYKASDGSQIVGLFKLKDGRWRASGPDKFTFTEPDERLAIARYRQWQARKGNATVSVPAASARVTDDKALAEAIRAVSTPTSNAEAMTGTFAPPGSKVETPALATPTPIRIEISGDTIELHKDPVQAAAFWAYLRRLILEKPKYIAQMTGIEQIGWLDKLVKPTVSPTLAEVGQEYADRTDVSPKELSRGVSTWKGFAKAVAVPTLRDLTPEHVATWGAGIRKKGYSPKYVAHHYNHLKTILNHFRTTGRAIDDVRHALDCCAVLKTPEAVSMDPHPISKVDFGVLLEVAEGDEKALLLVAMNLCFYPVDISRLRWGELDLERVVYHAKRGKTKVARVACLWPRTVDALKALTRSEDDDHVFHREFNGKPHTATTIGKWFRRLRTRARLPKTVQFADIRDGCFTSAVSGEGVEFQHAQVLAGHRTGIADNYVLRNPRMVAKACEAVEREYFG